MAYVGPMMGDSLLRVQTTRWFGCSAWQTRREGPDLSDRAELLRLLDEFGVPTVDPATGHDIRLVDRVRKLAEQRNQLKEEHDFVEELLTDLGVQSVNVDGDMSLDERVRVLGEQCNEAMEESNHLEVELDELRSSIKRLWEGTDP